MEDWLRVRDILRKYACNSLSYLSLEPDKEWFFAEGFEGVASFAISGSTMVVCGDPICPEDKMDDMLQQLLAYSKKEKLRLVFLFVLEKNLKHYLWINFGCQKSGEEAVFDVAGWSMAGGKCAKVRSSYHTALHHGLIVKEYCPYQQRDEAVEKQFHEISGQWLAQKHTSRLQFAVGSLMLDRPCDKRYFYAVDQEGVIQGFNVLNPYLSGKAWIVDIMRRREGCPHGVMELLFHDIMEKLQKEGAEEASLGIAPFFGTVDEMHPTLFEKAEHYIYEHMNGIYGFRPLWEAKDKYNPRWENVYLVSHPKHMSLWMDKAAFTVLDSNGFGDFVKSYFQQHKEE